MDISCPLVISSGAYNNVTSLAELLESGVATFEVWHQVSHMAYQGKLPQWGSSTLIATQSRLKLEGGGGGGGGVAFQGQKSSA